MELIIDSANLKDIRRLNESFCITGVTTNPTILARENRDYYESFYKIKEIIGNKQLHIQVTANDWQGMVLEAKALRQAIDPSVYIKVPSNQQGFRAMKELKELGMKITATVVYSPEQAILDALAGVDYAAVYYNKMYNLNMNPVTTVREISELYKANNISTKILTASFRNTRQVIESFLAGAQAVTVAPGILDQMTVNPVVDNIIEAFDKDWKEAFGPETMDKELSE